MLAKPVTPPSDVSKICSSSVKHILYSPSRDREIRQLTFPPSWSISKVVTMSSQPVDLHLRASENQ